MIALIDANSFFASCEQVYRPDLRGKPVVVLSNNDGCVIARNAEAKLLGIPMGEPYFRCRDFLRVRGVAFGHMPSAHSRLPLHSKKFRRDARIESLFITQ